METLLFYKQTIKLVFSIGTKIALTIQTLMFPLVFDRLPFQAPIKLKYSFMNQNSNIKLTFVFPILPFQTFVPTIPFVCFSFHPPLGPRPLLGVNSFYLLCSDLLCSDL